MLMGGSCAINQVMDTGSRVRVEFLLDRVSRMLDWRCMIDKDSTD